jgi:protein NrfC
MADVQGKKPEEKTNGKGMSRRTFIGTGAGLVVGGVAGGLIGSKMVSGPEAPSLPKAPASFTDIGGQTALRTLVTSMPPSAAYLVHDSTKCAFCQTCMMACSLAHEGKENISLSRIQIDANALGRYPNDLVMNVCRQCVTPVCVEKCPVGACQIDTANGNVRVIDQAKCIGCQTCISACPHLPHRTIWDSVAKKATKCDLCLNTPFWGEKGGPGGKQACVELCPMNAIKLVPQTPPQSEKAGYEVNLRSANYEGLVSKSNTTVWWQSTPAK